ncbi:peptidoglycan recognition protein [Streptomyces sp. NBC_00102]|uniref:peptidoglycan recognition protein family protein n=1 Tax=Streptomyces sp. NBC_00102 TaxID=2975652 RepID=UPI00225B313A|nr:peptidoglycan recognition protein [Streptomyces sp. NBC_00102]MCX5399859.1 peptidoglycan recognition protein [Streptomyces sp. NBC_00102]
MRSKRRIWTTAAVATAAVAGLLVFQGVTGNDGADGGVDAKSAPAKADVHENELKVSADGTTAAFEQKDTKPFSLLGVTWTDPAAKVSGTVEARTRSVATGEWTGWLPLATDVDGRTETGQSGVRGTTEPRWVGASDGVEVRVTSGGTSSAGLPAGLRLDTVDPGTSGSDAETAAYAQDMTEGFAEDGESEQPTPTDTTSAPETPDPTGTAGTDDPPETGELPGTPTGEPEPTATTTAPATGEPSVSATPTTPAPSPTTASPSPTPAPAPVSTMPKPPIVSRAGWGADESLNDEAPEYTTSVKAVFVHHTAQTNDYSCKDSPAIMRSLHAFHVRSNGWKDLGYNFIVDKCGTIFEGRKGGVDRPVFGAHTYGFNRETAGIAVIGMYSDTKASTPATTAVARLAAWKLGQYKGDPAGKTTLVAGATQPNGTGISFTEGKSYTFNQISGHRDGFNTECPGTALYGQLGAIRSAAAGPVTGLAISSVTGSSASGSTTYTQSGVKVAWTSATPAALVSKYELLVDGKVVATTNGSTTSASATLAVGTHKVQVRATHMSGKVAPLSAAATVVAEKTAPTFTTKPSLALSAGTVNTTAVPLTLKWKAADAIALREVRLTAPVAKTYSATTTSAAQTAKPGVATTWKMSAYDRAGNTAAASVAGTPVILQETSATRTGTWAAKSSTSYLGGKSYSSSGKNASISWTFTGRSAALVVSRASTSGQVYVYVDGKKTATVDLKSTTTKYRDAIWTTTWSAAAKHTVKLVVVGTTGRPAITTDGLVYLK